MSKLYLKLVTTLYALSALFVVYQDIFPTSWGLKTILSNVTVNHVLVWTYCFVPVIGYPQVVESIGVIQYVSTCIYLALFSSTYEYVWDDGLTWIYPFVMFAAVLPMKFCFDENMNIDVTKNHKRYYVALLFVILGTLTTFFYKYFISDDWETEGVIDLLFTFITLILVFATPCIYVEGSNLTNGGLANILFLAVSTLPIIGFVPVFFITYGFAIAVYYCMAWGTSHPGKKVHSVFYLFTNLRSEGLLWWAMLVASNIYITYALVEGKLLTNSYPPISDNIDLFEVNKVVIDHCVLLGKPAISQLLEFVSPIDYQIDKTCVMATQISNRYYNYTVNVEEDYNPWELESIRYTSLCCSLLVLWIVARRFIFGTNVSVSTVTILLFVSCIQFAITVFSYRSDERLFLCTITDKCTVTDDSWKGITWLVIAYVFNIVVISKFLIDEKLSYHSDMSATIARTKNNRFLFRVGCIFASLVLLVSATYFLINEETIRFGVSTSMYSQSDCISNGEHKGECFEMPSVAEMTVARVLSRKTAFQLDLLKLAVTSLPDWLEDAMLLVSTGPLELLEDIMTAAINQLLNGVDGVYIPAMMSTIGHFAKVTNLGIISDIESGLDLNVFVKLHGDIEFPIPSVYVGVLFISVLVIGAILYAVALRYNTVSLLMHLMSMQLLTGIFTVIYKLYYTVKYMNTNGLTITYNVPYSVYLSLVSLVTLTVLIGVHVHHSSNHNIKAKLIRQNAQTGIRSRDRVGSLWSELEEVNENGQP